MYFKSYIFFSFVKNSLRQPDNHDVHLLDPVQHLAEPGSAVGRSFHLHLQVYRLRRLAHAYGLPEQF